MENWRKKFVGREKELTHLIEAWKKAKEGNPQLIVLLGESGLGKTRLIQEFYSWLNKNEDPKNYWPDLLEETDNTLILNPKEEKFREDACRVQIPWLWCGVSFKRPITHGGQETYGCGLLEFQQFLTPHLKPLYIARQKRDIRNELIKKTAETVAEVAVDIFSLGAVSKIKNLLGIYTTGKKYIKTSQRMSLGEEKEGRIKDLSEELLSAFDAVCDPSNIDAATVPVVFILDDAQYADKYTLKFTQEFYIRAFKNKWPCLFLITHWEREWNLNISNYSVERKDNPAPFTDIIKNINSHIGEDWKPYQIGVVKDLSGVIKAAFPGITEGQSSLILKKAGGNPLLLAQIILWLSSERKYFKDKNLENQLTETALKIIKNKEFNLHNIFEERFLKIEDDIKEVLSFGSVQGMRFSHEITADLIKEVGISLTKNENELFKEAENPHSIISSLEGLRLKEFRQHIFYEIIRKRTSDLHDFEKLENELMKIMIEYLDDGKTKDLKPAEEETFLTLLLSLIESAISKSKETDRLNIYRLKATTKLFELYDRRYLFRQAYDMALKFANNYPEDGLSFGIVSLDMQLSIVFRLLSCRNFNAAEIYFKKLSGLLKKEWEGWGIDKIQDGRMDIELKEIMGIYRRIVEEYGKTPDNLRDLSNALEDVGDIDENQGRMDDALEKYKESVKICRDIVNEYGETPDNLRDLSNALESVGYIDENQGRMDDALEKYKEALEISRRIVKKYETIPVYLDDLSYFVDRLSAVMKKCGLDKDILDLYKGILNIPKISSPSHLWEVSFYIKYANKLIRLYEGDVKVDEAEKLKEEKNRILVSRYKIELPELPHIKFDRENFLMFLAGSMSQTWEEKIQHIKYLPELSQKQVDELMEILIEEKEKFEELNLKCEGKLNQLQHIQYEEWLEKVVPAIKNVIVKEYQ
ncbi:MAG: AAA family ATPase [Nitrospinae bacterium]|nr:AAA family ATPase [Nitrospinota bacterium]